MSASPDDSGRFSRNALRAAIVRKDLLLFSRDWLFIALTILSMTMFVTLYYLLPARVEPGFELGVRGSRLEPILEELAGGEEEGIPLRFFETTDSLREAVASAELDVGIDFSDDLLTAVAAGEQVTVTVFARSTLPPEYRGAVSTMVREIAFAVAGHELPVTEPDEETVLVGRSTTPVPIRDRMRPLYAFMVLVMEAIGLATLISSEVQQKTMTALLATPARVSDILLSKGVLGTLFAFGEAALVLLLVRGYGSDPAIVLVALLLGAVLVTGIAMIAGAAGKDLIGTMLLGMLILIPLVVPAFAVLFPGSAAVWMRAIPSYGLVATVLDSSVYGVGWAGVLPYLAMLAGWCVVSAFVGVVVLKRRVVEL